MKNSIFLLFTCLVVILVAPAMAISLPESERSVVVLFGDSLSVGENLHFGGPNPVGSTTRGCPTIYLNSIFNNDGERPAADSCETEGLSAPVYNNNNEIRNAITASWGAGGSNTTQGNARIISNLNTTKSQLAGNNYIALILYGTNDFSFGISSVTTRVNTVSMIQRARSVGYTPIVGLLTPRDDRTGPGPSGIQAYNSQIALAANSQIAPIVDHFSSFVLFPGGFTQVLDQQLFPGGLIRLHPNNQGYLLIAENWFDQQLKNMIPVVSDGSSALPAIINLLLDDTP